MFSTCSPAWQSDRAAESERAERRASNYLSPKKQKSPGRLACKQKRSAQKPTPAGLVRPRNGGKVAGEFNRRVVAYYFWIVSKSIPLSSLARRHNNITLNDNPYPASSRALAIWLFWQADCHAIAIATRDLDDLRISFPWPVSLAHIVAPINLKVFPYGFTAFRSRATVATARQISSGFAVSRNQYQSPVFSNAISSRAWMTCRRSSSGTFASTSARW